MSAAAPDRIALLVFRLGEAQYALPVDQVMEVAAMVAVVRVPDAPPALVGMLNRHGDALPLLDVRHVFGLPPLPVSATTLFIVVQAGARRAGLLVDEVQQVQYVAAAALQPVRGAGRLIYAMLGTATGLIQLLALEPLLLTYLPETPPDSGQAVRMQDAYEK
jgi:purine-binding chemotaxis protein CheW